MDRRLRVLLMGLILGFIIVLVLCQMIVTVKRQRLQPVNVPGEYTSR